MLATKGADPATVDTVSEAGKIAAQSSSPITLDYACPCGSEIALIKPGRGPHAAELRCSGCDRHRGWISHDDFKAFQKFVAECATRWGASDAISWRAIKRLADQTRQQEANQMNDQKFQTSNSGVLFKNEKKTSEKHSDYRGEVNAAGVDYWLDGWVRESKKGLKFISFKLKRKEQQKEVAPAPFNDDVPF